MQFMADRISIKNYPYEKGSCTKVQLPFFTKTSVYKNNLSVNLRLMVLENKL